MKKSMSLHEPNPAGPIFSETDFQQYKALHDSDPDGPIFVEGALEDPEFIEVTDRFFKSPAARLLLAYLRDLDDGVSPNSNEVISDAL